ncbi:MAG: hypothetical protein JW888_16040 [Pirellulales bacterium]|nr:hypothetical protein [Pirellulales bacterium]
MQINRGMVRTAALLAGFALVVSTAIVVWWHSSRFDPATADQEELFCWLVTNDLNEVPPETRSLVADRLDEAFSEEIDWEKLAGRLTDDHRARLWANVPLLLEPWFMKKVDAYSKCPADKRTASVDRIIDTLSSWSGLDALQPESENGADSPKASRGLKDMLFDQIDKWRSRAKPDEQQRIEQFVTAIQVRWLFRQWASQLDNPKSPG